MFRRETSPLIPSGATSRNQDNIVHNKKKVRSEPCPAGPVYGGRGGRGGPGDVGLDAWGGEGDQEGAQELQAEPQEC